MQVTAYGPRSVGTKASFGTTPFGIQTSFGTKASSETGRPGIARRYARAVRDRLPAWPSAGNRRREWMRWALHLAGWLLPGLIVLWVVVAYVGAASRLLLALPGPSADAPRSSTLLWMAMGLDTSSWWALPHAAGPWVGAAVAPAVVWWVARRDLTLGRLVLGALGRPMLLLARPVVFGLVVGRALLGRPATDPVGEPPAAAPLIGPDILREEPVFVDSTGRRNRRVWTVAYASGLAGLAYVVALLIALATGQIPPHAVGEGPRLDFPVPARTPPAMPQPVPIEPPVEIEQSVEVRPSDLVGPVATTQAGSADETVPPTSVSPSVGPTEIDEPTSPPESSVSPLPLETRKPFPTPSLYPSVTPDPSPPPGPSLSPPEGFGTPIIGRRPFR